MTALFPTLSELKNRGAVEVARWTKPGGSLLLLSVPRAHASDEPRSPAATHRNLLLQRRMDGRYIPCSIRVQPRSPGVRSVYSERPTLEQADEHATANGYERRPS